jgi:hypothetical protein
MYFPDDLWLLIKSFKFHNIKTQGKHLKPDLYIKLYNFTLKLMPPLIFPRLGPKIIYSSAKNKDRFVKFIYLRPMKFDMKTKKYFNNFVIRETQVLDVNLLHADYSEQYYSNF